MLNPKCIYCEYGYEKKNGKHCIKCRNNPHYTPSFSKDLKDYFVKGTDECMQIEGENPWTI